MRRKEGGAGEEDGSVPAAMRWLARLGEARARRTAGVGTVLGRGLHAREAWRRVGERCPVRLFTGGRPTALQIDGRGRFTVRGAGQMGLWRVCAPTEYCAMESIVYHTHDR
jgi:hypothetical protein